MLTPQSLYSPVNYSSRELWLSSGLPSVHNMVWIAMSPNKKRSREHNSDHVAEAGNITAQAAMRTDMDRPGKAKPEQLNEAALIRRYRRGQRKVNEQGAHHLEIWIADRTLR